MVFFSNPRENEDLRHRHVLDTISSELVRLFTIVNKRNTIHRTRSEASNLTKEKESYDDLLPRIVTLGEEIQMLQKSKSELSRYLTCCEVCVIFFVCNNKHYQLLRQFRRSRQISSLVSQRDLQN